MNVGVISRNVGTALIVNSLFMFLCVIASAINGFDSSFSPLFLSAIITLIFGVFPLIFVRKQKEVSVREGLTIIIFAWILCCLFGMIPYVLWGGEYTLANAWFESASGYTTTGASILTQVENLPKGLQLWRSSTHYIGGLGVVVFIMLVLPSWGASKLRMSNLEIQDVSKFNYKYKSNQLIRVEIIVYLALTIVCLICLMFAGMSFFDALNHAFSTVSTGGFSTRNASIASFDSVAIEVVLEIFMILSSIHFGLIYSSVIGRNGRIFKDPVTKFYLRTIVVTTVLITLNLWISGTFDSLWIAFRQGFFHVASFVSSTGFAIGDTLLWPTFSMFILIYISIQCGCSGSTTGGLKSDRIWIMIQATKAQLTKIIHPNAVLSIKNGGHIIDKELVNSVSVFILTYLLIILVCAVCYSGAGMDFTDSLTTSVSFMGNVGPAFGNYGSLGNYSTLPLFVKLLAGLEMIMGRLGVFPALIIFSLFNRK